MDKAGLILVVTAAVLLWAGTTLKRRK